MKLNRAVKVAIDKTAVGFSMSAVAETIGYPAEIPAYENEIINGIAQEIREHCQIRAGYLVVKPTFDSSTSVIAIDEFKVNLQVSKIILSQLKSSEYLVAMICTLGPELDRILVKYREQQDFVAEYFVDVIGSVYAEAVAEYLHGQIANHMRSSGLGVTNRYSPGYCHWSVAEQAKLFQLFPKGFCEVALSDSSLMTPIKSISAVLGVGEKSTRRDYNCRKCEHKNCLYRESVKSKTASVNV